MFVDGGVREVDEAIAEGGGARRILDRGKSHKTVLVEVDPKWVERRHVDVAVNAMWIFYLSMQ